MPETKNPDYGRYIENIVSIELSPLMKTKAAYPKMIVTRTLYREDDIDGIKITDISDWLLK